MTKWQCSGARPALFIVPRFKRAGHKTLLVYFYPVSVKNCHLCLSSLRMGSNKNIKLSVEIWTGCRSRSNNDVLFIRISSPFNFINKQQKIFSSLPPINVNVKCVEYIITLIICCVDWFLERLIKVTIFLTWLTIACCYPSPLDYVNNKFVSIRSSTNSGK